jgi:hypothetical protein
MPNMCMGGYEISGGEDIGKESGGIKMGAAGPARCPQR